jgi:hypothetical protein
MKTKMLAATVLVALGGFVAAQSSAASSAKDVVCTILNNLSWLLMAIAAAVGVVVIVLQGIKWAGSAEDPGARKQAKQGIIHAVIGLIIVILAVWIVALVFTKNACKGIGGVPGF